MCLASTFEVLLLKIILQLNFRPIAVCQTFNFGIISLKPHGLSYSFSNTPLIDLSLTLMSFGAFDETVLCYKSRYNLIVHVLIHTQEN
jgi:hypothetical protein